MADARHIRRGKYFLTTSAIAEAPFPE